MPLRLEGRVTVVTGASGGIGRAVALAYAGEGAAVLVHYHSSEEAAEETCDAIRSAGGRAHSVQADVSDPEGAERLARAARERFGRVDAWTNLAGFDILTGSGAELADLEKLERLLAVDVRGTVLCSWTAAGVMRDAGSGVIINTSWDQAVVGHSMGAKGREAELYATAKAAVLGFSKALARSLAPEIRVNVLAPGWIRTDYYHTLGEQTRRRIAERSALGRWGTPEDVARAAVFLASDDSAYLTGQVVAVGGGEVM